MPSLALPDGFLAGHWTDAARGTGCTVLLAPPGSVSAGEVRGGGPGTRESDLLSPATSTDGPQAVLFTGGSALGLGAADGVAGWLAARGVGHPTPAGPVPLVMAGVVYDLAYRERAWPDAAAGAAACDAARDVIERGSVGAGTGATAGKLAGFEGAAKTGIGAAADEAGGVTLVAVAVANPVGDVLAADGSVLAGARDGRAVDLLRAGLAPRIPERENTTLVALLTDARLTKPQAWIVARAMSAGVARAVSPSGTSFDGDLTVCMASGRVECDPRVVGPLAAEVVSEAIRDAARSA